VTNASATLRTFWDRDLIRRLTACFVAVMVSRTAHLAAQEKPDFSGSWILESGASGTDIPHALLVSQSLVRTNVRGEPMQPFFKDITVTRVLASSTRSETYQIGVVGGSVSVGFIGQQTHHRVAWEERALVIESGSYTGPVPESGDWAERREVWSLDSGVRLRLAITVRSSLDAPKMVMLVYRKE
jgi:hypothetical protein